MKSERHNTLRSLRVRIWKVAFCSGTPHQGPSRNSASFQGTPRAAPFHLINKMDLPLDEMELSLAPVHFGLSPGVRASKQHTIRQQHVHICFMFPVLTQTVAGLPSIEEEESLT